MCRLAAREKRYEEKSKADKPERSHFSHPLHRGDYRNGGLDGICKLLLPKLSSNEFPDMAQEKQEKPHR
ncbi:MAG: hypothetical protein OEQ14_13815, partial [Gammaproteobacteria bacterium]|nr:hypothetical protein [Gammaproteobacteria bacterium]